MGVKIALYLISSYTYGGIDRNGQEVSPMQVINATYLGNMSAIDQIVERSFISHTLEVSQK